MWSCEPPLSREGLSRGPPPPEEDHSGSVRAPRTVYRAGRNIGRGSGSDPKSRRRAEPTGRAGVKRENRQRRSSLSAS